MNQLDELRAQARQGVKLVCITGKIDPEAYFVIALYALLLGANPEVLRFCFINEGEPTPDGHAPLRSRPEIGMSEATASRIKLVAEALPSKVRFGNALSGIISHLDSWRTGYHGGCGTAMGADGSIWRIFEQLEKRTEHHGWTRPRLIGLAYEILVAAVASDGFTPNECKVA